MWQPNRRDVGATSDIKIIALLTLSLPSPSWLFRTSFSQIRWMQLHTFYYFLKFQHLFEKAESMFVNFLTFCEPF